MGKIESSPVITKNKVIAASNDGRLYIIYLETGEKLWSYEIGSAITGTPAVIKNTVIVGANDGRVYIFGK